MFYLAFVLFLLCGMAQAAGPVLFFTDITSGPKSGGQNNLGAFITIYGEGFGAVRGSSTVTIGGAEVANYVTWGEDNAVARRLDQIVVQPGANAATGNIIVTVNGIASNPLPFTVRAGDIFFVIPNAPNASDSNPGTFQEPFETMFRQSGEMSAGDIVYVKGGTFDSPDPRAPGWDCAICFFPDNDPIGTSAAPVAWIGYPGDPPVLGAPQPMRRAIFMDGAMQHYVIANMRFTHYGGMMELSGDWIRIIGNYTFDGLFSNCCAIGVTGDTAHYKIYGNYLRNNGEPGEKMSASGFYVQGFGTNEDIDFGWNQIQDQQGARPIQVYGHLDGDWITELRIHDNLITGSEMNDIVLGGSDGSNDVLGTVYVYNNIITGAADPGLRVNDPNGTVIIQNNVLYNNGTPGLNGSTAQLYLERAGVGKITLRNNILYAVSPQTYVQIDAPAGSAVLVAGNNLYFNGGSCPDWELTCINADPQFVSLATLDFHLQSGSPAVNSGADTGITRDYAGVPRPQGGSYDIGAFEYEQVVPGITASPSTLDLGSIATGSASAPEVLTVSNTSASELHTGVLNVSGIHAADFSIQNDLVSSTALAASQSRTVEIVMTPGAGGARIAQLNIPSDDPNTPVLTVALYGTGVSPELWSDTFSDGDASDWTHNKGVWAVLDEDLAGTNLRKSDNISPFSGCRVCTIETDLRVETAGCRASLLAWRVDARNLVEVRMMEDKDKWMLIQKLDGVTVAKGKALRPITPGTNYHISARYDGSSLQVFVDGDLLLSALTTTISSGTVGFRVKSTTGVAGTMASREIFVYPL